MINYLLFDAANTLIHKPMLWDSILDVLLKEGFVIDKKKLIYNHKLLSETINFPDRTNEDFYLEFNRELLQSLGIIGTPELLSLLFEKCSYLPWEKFDDTMILNTLELPMAILSNFNVSLSKLIAEKVDVKFNEIISSEKEGIRKPNIDFYKLAIDKLGIKASEILYIGDSLKLDYMPARSAGMHALIIDRVNFYPTLKYVIHDFSSIKHHIKLINESK
jgi:putative hydrolase of the HAD superfamily